MIDIEDVNACEIVVSLGRDIWILKPNGTYLRVARFDSKLTQGLLRTLRTCLVSDIPCYAEHEANFLKRTRKVWIQGKPIFALDGNFKAAREVRIAICYKIFRRIARGQMHLC